MEKSKLFLSWSGERSKKVATILGAWLEDVLQTVEPFMSDTDIAAGDVWFDQIGANLEASQFAIICVTPENANSKWLHFEAGAIGMTRSEGTRGAVVPYLVGLRSADLTPPLSLFQTVPADKQGTFRVVQAINSVLAVGLDASRLERTFDRWWPDLETALTSIPEPAERMPTLAERSDREILEELLSLVRRRPSTLLPRSQGPDGGLDRHGSGWDRVVERRLRPVFHALDIASWSTLSLKRGEETVVEVKCHDLPVDVSHEHVQEALDQLSQPGLRFTLVHGASMPGE
jgi:hypothetical protein